MFGSPSDWAAKLEYVNRISLERFLSEGLSLAEIGRRVGLHEATVGYWVQKYGLVATGREKHASRGGLRREELKSLIEQGATIAEIADAVDRSTATVRHWLREYGLKTRRAERRWTPDESQQQLQLCCPRHGVTMFKRRSDRGYKCAKCRAEAVTRRRRKVKRMLVEKAGGRCTVCGYSRCVAALEFHHLVPSEKSFSLSHRGVARSLEKAMAEASKCALLCANCHAEVEAGMIMLT